MEEQSLQAWWLQVPKSFVGKFADLNDIRKISSIRIRSTRVRTYAVVGVDTVVAVGRDDGGEEGGSEVGTVVGWEDGGVVCICEEGVV